jgi:hypothetical protein
VAAPPPRVTLRAPARADALVIAGWGADPAFTRAARSATVRSGGCGQGLGRAAAETGLGLALGGLALEEVRAEADGWRSRAT